MSYNNDNKRIAKNTLILYARMFLTVGISLYTTRLVMGNLGVSDYGLYSIIGGFTSMMYLVTTSISGGVSRFLTFQLGKGDIETLRKVFSTSVIILLAFSLLVLLIGEVGGIWYISHKLNIEPGRLEAAHWVYQFTLLAFILEFLSIPYNSSIVSHERMKAFASVTILDVVIRLVIAIAISFEPFDRLVYYAMLMCLNQVVLRLVYYVYCKRYFVECSFTFVFDWGIFKSILGYCSWAILTTAICMISSTGLSLMLNAFYGTVVNAAQSISGQIMGQVGAFANNFSKALAPQITKKYASGELTRSLTLVYSGAKFSFLLLFFPILPILFEVDFVLDFWLKETPPFADMFVCMTLINALINNLMSMPYVLTTATGDIRNNELYVGLVYLIPFPLSYFLLQMGYPPYVTVISSIIVNIVSFYPRVMVSRKYSGISFSVYAAKVLLPLSYIVSLSLLVQLLLHYLLLPSWNRLLLSGFLSVASVASLCYLIALSPNERKMARNIIISRLKISNNGNK